MPSQPILKGFERPEPQNGRPAYHDPMTELLPQATRLEKILEALRAATQPHTASQIAGKALLHNHDNITGEDLMVLLNEGKVRQVGDMWAVNLEVINARD